MLKGTGMSFEVGGGAEGLPVWLRCMCYWWLWMTFGVMLVRTSCEQAPLLSNLKLSGDPPQVRVKPSGHKIEWGRGTGKRRKTLKTWLGLAVGTRVPKLWR